MNRKKQTYQMPDCLGWYSPCEECDGDPEDRSEEGAPCVSREGCKLILGTLGGVEFRDDEAVENARDHWPAHKIARWFAPEFAKRKKKPTAKLSKFPRTKNPDYKNAYIIIDAIAARIAEQTECDLIHETKSHKRGGDLYLHYRENSPKCSLYIVRRRRRLDLRVMTFHPSIDKARTSVRINCLDFETAFALNPPSAVELRHYSEGPTKPASMALVGVEADSALLTGSWVARLITNELIGKKL